MLKFYGFDFCDVVPNCGWTAGFGGFTREATIYRNGTHSYKGTGGSYVISPNYGNLATVYVGVAVRWASLASVGGAIALYDGATAQLTVTVETDGTLKVRRGDYTGTVLASSSAGVFHVDTWHHLQLMGTIHGSSGAFELRLDGTAVASASGVNTKNSGNAYSNVLWLISCPANWGYYDDCWITDTAFMGDCKVETLYPSANGTTNNFAVSGAASNYQAVDDSTDFNSDTDYTYSANAGDKDLFAMQNMATLTGTVKAVNVNAVVRKDDVGARTAALLLRNAGVESVRSTQTLTTSYAVYSETFTTDPTSSTAWTISTVNSLETGLKIIS